MSKHNQKLFVALLFLSAILLSACQGAAAPASTGRTDFRTLLADVPAPLSEGKQAEQTFIALVVNDGLAAVYICDGEDVSEWLGGAASGDRLDLTSDKGTHLTAN